MAKVHAPRHEGGSQVWMRKTMTMTGPPLTQNPVVPNGTEERSMTVKGGH